MSEYDRNGNGKTPDDPETQLFSFRRQAEQESEDALLGGLDLVRIYYILKRNVFWLILLPVVCLLSGYVYLRYTKPLFESSSSIKLEIEQKANLLGLNGVSTNEDLSANLSGEIELIRSKLIYDEVIRRMDIDVSCYTYGNILDEERYRNAPFQVTYERKNFIAYDQPFDVTMLSPEQYKLSYQVNGSEQSSTYSFGQVVRTEGFSFVVDTTSFYSPDLNGKKFYFIINSPGALSNYLASNMRVDVLNPAANILGVAFKDHTPAKAHDIVNTIDSVYLDKTLELKNKANKQKIGFLEDQLRITEDSLERYESQQERFIVQNKTADVKADVGKYVTTIEELIKQRTELEGQLLLLQNLQRLLDQKDDLSSFIPSVPLLNDAQLATLTQEINRLQQERALTLTSSKETTSAVRSKDKAIEIARQNIVGLISQDKQLVLGKMGQVNARIREFERTFTGLPAKGTEYTKIQRFKDLYEKYYLLIMDRKAELGIAEAGTVPEFVILSPASVPSQSIFPNRMMAYGASGAVGLLLSLLLLTLKYLLHDTISNQRELERTTEAPILGAIPTYNQESMDVSRLIVHKNPKASISEAMRSIRTNLEFVFPSGRKKRIISVTSTVSGEGKTFVALNLSGIIALSDAKVVLIDLDMRKPKINLAFDEENNSGVSTILIGKHSIKECIRQTPIDTLDYIAAGPTPPNPSELILRPEFDIFLKELHKLYDVIVIDTPPVGLVTDGILVMKKADLPIYVVRADYSKRYFVKNINKLIKNNNFTRLSVVLNAFKHLSQYGYGYDYSYYQGYSDEEKPENKGISKIKGLLAKTK